VDRLRLLKRMIKSDDLFEKFLTRCEPEMSSSFERHSRLRAKLIKFFGWKHCEDPEFLADETIGRLVTTVYSGETIEQPAAYALGTARNVYREYVRRQAKLAPINENTEAADEKQLSTDDPEPFIHCARLCFQRLPHDKRLLLERYYSDEMDRGELARQESISLAGLRTKIHRLKAELRDCYNECIGPGPD
jgi:DNA-directed RNA polymerase specialized sigma24 family protein